MNFTVLVATCQEYNEAESFISVEILKVHCRPPTKEKLRFPLQMVFSIISMEKSDADLFHSAIVHRDASECKSLIFQLFRVLSFYVNLRSN